MCEVSQLPEGIYGLVVEHTQDLTQQTQSSGTQHRWKEMEIKLYVTKEVWSYEIFKLLQIISVCENIKCAFRIEYGVVHRTQFKRI